MPRRGEIAFSPERRWQPARADGCGAGRTFGFVCRGGGMPRCARISYAGTARRCLPCVGGGGSAPADSEGVYGSNFVGDYRTMAFAMSIAFTPSVAPDGVTAPPTQGSLFCPVRLSVVFYCPSIAGQAGEACLAPTMPRRGLFLNSQTGSADPRTDRSSPRSLLRLRSRRRPIQTGSPQRGRCRSPPECPPHRRRTRFCIFPSGSGW